MSPPSGKPTNPTDLAAYLLDRMRERADVERDSVEGGDHPPYSPYAPKRAHQRSPERLPVENDHDPLRSPYAPKKARAQPAANPNAAVRVDAEPAPPVRAPQGVGEQPAEARAVPGAKQNSIDADQTGGAPAGARDHRWPLASERDGRNNSQRTAFEEDTKEHPVDLDASISSLTANSGRHEQPAAERRDEIMSDRDLERLEASLRWLQRQEGAARLPRATPLAPVPGLPSVEASSRRRSGDRFDNDLRLPPSLECERPVLPPMRPHRGNLRGPLWILAASMLVAPIVYYFWGGRWDFSSAPEPQIASLNKENVSSPPMSADQQQPWPIRAQGNDPEGPASGGTSSQQTTASRTARTPESATVAMLPPSASEAGAPPENRAVRALAPEDVKLLTKQGEQFVLAGDLVTARILFQRAAEAGDAAAAMALGATYDPIVLTRLGVVGIGADVEKARTWYRKAESQGSTEATQRLHALANR
jgi:hypothetical protein